MTQNLQSLFANLQKTAEETNSQGSGRKYPYRVVFIKPDDPAAKLNVRILYNQQSNSVTFPYFTHKMKDGSTLACGKNNHNNPTCELCNAIENKKNMGRGESIEAAKSRAVMLAQYVSSSGYTWDAKYPAPAVGETVLVIGPASLHKQISNMLVTIGFENLPKLLTNATGNVITISRDSSGKQVVVTPTYGTHMSAANDEQFDTFLKSFPSLENIILFGGMTQEDYQKLHEAAVAINRTLGTVEQPQSFKNPTLDEQTASVGPMGNMFSPAPQPANTFQSITTGTPLYSANSEVLTNGAPVPQQSTVSAPVTVPTTNAVLRDQQTAATLTPTFSTPAQQPATVPQPASAPAPTNVPTAGLEAFISSYCQKTYDAKSPICQMCLAEKFCPFKTAIVSDALPTF